MRAVRFDDVRGFVPNTLPDLWRYSLPTHIRFWNGVIVEANAMHLPRRKRALFPSFRWWRWKAKSDMFGAFSDELTDVQVSEDEARLLVGKENEAEFDKYVRQIREASIRPDLVYSKAVADAQAAFDKACSEAKDAYNRVIEDERL